MRKRTGAILATASLATVTVGAALLLQPSESSVALAPERVSDAAVLVPRITDEKPEPVRPVKTPALAKKAAPARPQAASRSSIRYTHGDRSRQAVKDYARTYMSVKYGWGSGEWQCLEPMWTKESDWRWNSDDSDNGYTWGIPQARPGTKMAQAGADWYSNPETQVRWGLRYIQKTYGTPCSAWDFWGSHHWY